MILKRLTLTEKIAERVEKFNMVKAIVRDMKKKLPLRFSRGFVQRAVFERAGLPRTVENMRVVNEVMVQLGFKSITLYGEKCYKQPM